MDMQIRFCLSYANYVETKSLVMIYFMVKLKYITGNDPEKCE